MTHQTSAAQKRDDQTLAAQFIDEAQNYSYDLVDKREWADGPWKQEPDRVEFAHAGLKCLVLRLHGPGNLNGYVGVKAGRPAYGQTESYEDGAVLTGVSVHGDLTFTGMGEGSPRRPDGYWWLGFDTGHYQDFSPGTGQRIAHVDDSTAYRDLAYVMGECRSLAEQLAALAVSAGTGSSSRPTSASIAQQA